MSAAEGTRSAEKLPVLLFLADGRRYGVPLSRVREVVEIEELQPIEGEAEDYIGVMVLRDEPVPLVSIHHEIRESDARLPMCIVMQRDRIVVGLAVERILGIRNFGPAHPLKGLTASARPQYAYLDDDRRLVQAVDADLWFDNLAALPQAVEQQRADAAAGGTAVAEDKAKPTYMALTVGERLFAVDSKLVDRAIDDIGVVPLPKRPGVRLDSVIEVSGNVLPVLRLSDQRLEAQAIYIIVNYYEQKWAIAAERVLGIFPDESPGRQDDDEVQARVISSRGSFLEVIEVPGLIAAMVPDFIRPDGQRV